MMKLNEQNEQQGIEQVISDIEKRVNSEDQTEKSLKSNLISLRKIRRTLKKSDPLKRKVDSLIKSTKEKIRSFNKAEKIDNKAESESKVESGKTLTLSGDGRAKMKSKVGDTKFVLIRKADNDPEHDVYVFKAKGDTPMILSDGRLSDEAFNFLYNIFDSTDFKSTGLTILNVDNKEGNQKLVFKIDKTAKPKNNDAVIDETELDKKQDENVEDKQSEENTEAKHSEENKKNADEAKKKEALAVILAAKPDRKKSSFESFDTDFLTAWADAIRKKIPFFKYKNKEYRTMNARALKGNEKEVLDYKLKHNIEPLVKYSATSYGNRKFKPYDIKAMQEYMMAQRDPSISNIIKQTGGVDGKIGKGFVKAFNTLKLKGLVSDIDDLYKKAIEFKNKTNSDIKTNTVSVNQDTLDPENYRPNVRTDLLP